MSPLIDAGLFLVQTVFSLYIMIVMLRILMQLTHSNSYNPVAQFVFKITNPLTQPLQSFIPSLRQVDLAALTLMVGLQFLKLLLIGWLKAGTWLSLGGLLIWSIGEIFSLLISIYFFAILIVVIVSWIMPNAHNPVMMIIQDIVAPVLNLARRYTPHVAGFDLSPIIVIVALKLIEILLVGPIIGEGVSMSFAEQVITQPVDAAVNSNDWKL